MFKLPLLLPSLPLSKRNRYCHSVSICHAVCVCACVCLSVFPPSRNCIRVALVLAAKVMRCMQCCLVIVIIIVIIIVITIIPQRGIPQHRWGSAVSNWANYVGVWMVISNAFIMKRFLRKYNRSEVRNLLVGRVWWKVDAHYWIFALWLKLCWCL